MPLWDIFAAGGLVNPLEVIEQITYLMFIHDLDDSKYMDDAIFKLPTPLVLSKVVDSLDEIYEMMDETKAADVRGDVCEYLLSKIAQSGRNGQFRTPRHIIRMMVEMMNPSSEEVICDPACGTSGFLVAAGEFLKETKKKKFSMTDKRKTII